MGNQLLQYDELTKKSLNEIYKIVCDPYSRSIESYTHIQEVMRYKYLSSDCDRVLYQISMYEIEMISKALRTNKSLVKLDLSKTNMTDDQLIYLINNGLTFSTSLQHLILRENRITCIGAAHLCKFLCMNEKITKLDISSNFIGSRGFRSIGVMLRNNKKLSYLEVKGNIQSFEDNQWLNSGLEQNQSILYFRNRFFYFREVIFIKSIIERNVSRNRGFSF